MGFNAENLKVKVTTGNPEIDERPPCHFKSPTLQSVLGWIETLSLDPQLKAELKKTASKYPNASLPNFLNNYQKLITRIRKKLREEKETITQLRTGEKENDNDRKEEDSKEEGGKESGCTPEKDSQICDGPNCSLRYSSASNPGDEFGKSSIDPWESTCADEDGGGRPNVHSDVQDEGVSDGRLGGKCDERLERGESDSIDSGDGSSGGLRVFDAASSGIRGTDSSEGQPSGDGDYSS